MIWVWEAYTILSSSRQHHPNGVPARISMTEIVSLCFLLNIKDQDNIDLLLTAIEALDEAFIADAIEKIDQREKRKKNTGT